MSTVYKFCGKYGLEILRNLEMKVTPPNEFNDPFEFTPRMVCSDPVACARRDLGQEANLRKLYELYRFDRTFLGAFPEFQEIAKKRMPEMLALMAQAPHYTLPEVQKELLDEVSKRFGVLCMSERRDSILMWGHYCDNLLGLVIGFDSKANIFQQEKSLRPVVYRNERVVFDYFWDAGSPEMAVFEDRVVLTKSKDWDYEDELRQIFPLSSSSLIKKPLKCNPSVIGYFLPFPAEAIASITLAPRCSPDLVPEVRQLLQKPSLSHVACDQAVLHQNDFVMQFEPPDKTRDHFAPASVQISKS